MAFMNLNIFLHIKKDIQTASWQQQDRAGSWSGEGHGYGIVRYWDGDYHIGCIFGSALDSFFCIEKIRSHDGSGQSCSRLALDRVSYLKVAYRISILLHPLVCTNATTVVPGTTGVANNIK